MALRLAVLALLFVWSIYLFDRFESAVAFTAAAFLTFIVILRIVKKTSRKSTCGRRKLEFQISVLGGEYALSLFKATFPEAAETEGGRCFVCGDTLVWSAYKFSPCGLEDVCSAYRTATDKGLKNVTVLCRDVDRKCYALKESLGIKIDFVKSKELYKKLQKENLLPIPQFEKTPSKISPREVVDLAFSKQNVRYYLTSGIMLTLISLVSPVKTYYVLIGTLSLVLALICAVKQ